MKLFKVELTGSYAGGMMVVAAVNLAEATFFANDRLLSDDRAELEIYDVEEIVVPADGGVLAEYSYIE